MSIQFIKAGLQTSIQDSGRFGQMHNGVGQSGAMDPVAMQMANWLVSKPINSAVIEIALIGPIIQFDCNLSIAVCGAQFDLYLNGNLVFNDETIQITKGDILEFDILQHGSRAYLAFSGELDLAPVFESYSTHLTAGLGGYKGRAFLSGDRLSINDIKQTINKKIPSSFRIRYSGKYLLRCVPSTETSRFSDNQRSVFFSQSFKVTPQLNRMGIRLIGKPLLFKDNFEIISSGLVQGSIQIPPSGQPIISSVDGQTIGGYPRIANIITADLPILGQLKANDKTSFVLIKISEAISILREKQSKLDFLSRKAT